MSFFSFSGRRQSINMNNTTNGARTLKKTVVEPKVVVTDYKQTGNETTDSAKKQLLSQSSVILMMNSQSTLNQTPTGNVISTSQATPTEQGTPIMQGALSDKATPLAKPLETSGLSSVRQGQPNTTANVSNFNDRSVQLQLKQCRELMMELGIEHLLKTK